MVFAIESPAQLTPTNNETVTSLKLIWQIPNYDLFNTNPYRIQVDDVSDISSPNKDYYTSNTSYTPSLSFGKWYWKIKSRDTSGTWSDWSPVWSFTFSESVQASNEPAPSSSISPSPSPSSSPSTNPSPSPTPISNIFTISNIPNQIDLNSSFNINLVISLPNTPNTQFYLKGAFVKPGSTNYFGLTNTSSGWSKNSAAASSQKSITTDNSGNWSGNLEVKPDKEDSGYQGGGNYIFKVARYSSSGSNLNWSNEVNINIADTKPVANTPPPQTTKEVKNIKTLSLAKPSSKAKPPDLTPKDSSVAGISNEATTSTLIKNYKQINYYFIIAGFAVLGAGGFYLVKLYQNR